MRAGYTVSDLVKDNSNKSLSISSTSCDLPNNQLPKPNFILHTCYNKYLSSQLLPPLLHPQTIESFFAYINKIKHTSNRYLYKPIISIKKDHSEAHIYLSNEFKPLKDHIILQTDQYLKYSQIPLRSYSEYTTPNTVPDIFISTPVSIPEVSTTETNDLNQNPQDQLYSNPS
ncbi:13888_t:CDS:1, partial [Ambispora leptoticha]